MSVSPSASRVDADLVARWLAARSIARGLPAPIAEAGGWRVDTRSEVEWCRYVFATANSGLVDLAHAIEQPRIFLKLCAEDGVLAALLPERWTLAPHSWLMTTDVAPPEPPCPEGYTPTIEHMTSGAIKLSIVAADGALAASGYAAEANGVFVYDRIKTSVEHRRRGLGRALMALLRSQRASHRSREVLVATEQGRALYTTLGWRVHAPYATAFISDPAP